MTEERESLEARAPDVGPLCESLSDGDVVTSLASGLYAELERLVVAHGDGAASGLVPLVVTTLETLQEAYSESRAWAEQAAAQREDNHRLMAQYERERIQRKAVQERCLELEDSLEQEQRSQKSSLDRATRQIQEMELKARSYADMVSQLEEEKGSWDRDYSRLQHKYNLLAHNLRNLEKQQKLDELQHCRSTINRHQEMDGIPNCISDGTRSLPGYGNRMGEEQQGEEQQGEEQQGGDPLLDSLSYPPPEDPHPTAAGPEPPLHPPSNTETREGGRGGDAEIKVILESVPELQQQVTESPTASPPNDSGADRNMDSILQEIRDAGPEFIGEIDGGIGLFDLGLKLEPLVSERAELQEQHAASECARRSLIARVQELSSEREELKQRVAEGALARREMEARIADLEQTLHSFRKQASDSPREKPEIQREADVASSQTFTRAEMTSVLTERNLYKHRLLELQDALRRMDRARALKSLEDTQARKSSLWERFSRLLSRPPVPRPTLPAPGPLALRTRDGDGSRNPGLDGDAAVTEQQRELYSRVRAHIWRELGRAQDRGWSLVQKEDPEISRVGSSRAPALLQVRLLDQKDPNSKLCCAVEVQTPGSEGTRPDEGVPGGLWVCSGTDGDTEVMVVNAQRASHLLQHFPLGQGRAVCAASVPGHRANGEGSGGGQASQPAHHLSQSEGIGSHQHTSAEPTVWIGTQTGSLHILARTCCQRVPLHTLRLSHTVHSLTYTRGFVVATLGNGSLEIFHRIPDGSWDMRNSRRLELGGPGHPVLCSVEVHSTVWCGVRSRVCVIDPQEAHIQKWLEVSAQDDGQVMLLAARGAGVWIALQREPGLRLFDAVSGRCVQEINLQPFVTTMFGHGPPHFPPTEVTALSVLCQRLWIGTWAGFVISVPLSDANNQELEKGSFLTGTDRTPQGQENRNSAVPYGHMERAQICFHGHRGPVKFFTASAVTSGAELGKELKGGGRSMREGVGKPATLIVSGGEGYMNFRIGEDCATPRASGRTPKLERSHLLVWASEA